MALCLAQPFGGAAETSLESKSNPQWDLLPTDAVSLLVNHSALSAQDVGAMRLTCSVWHSAVDNTVEQLQPCCTTLEQFMVMPSKFPLLTHLDIRKFDYRLFNHQLLFTRVESILSTFLHSLANMPSLTSLTISTEFAREMGRKTWAHFLCSEAFDEGKLSVLRGSNKKDLSISRDALPNISSMPTALRSASDHSNQANEVGASTSSSSRTSAALKEDDELRVVKQYAEQPQTTFQIMLWIPDWLPQLTGVRHLSIIPDKCDSRWYEPVSGDSSPTLVWFKRSSLAFLSSMVLAGTKLGAFPQELTSLSSLSILDLRECEVATLPNALHGLSNLKRLLLCRNALKALPPTIADLVSLQELDLSHNSIVGIPDTICRLSCLEFLNLSNNQLKDIPTTLGLLPALKELNLSHNWLQGLPSFYYLCNLRSLVRLEVQNVSDKDHKLRVVPEFISLKSLRHLDLSLNGVEPLPELGDLVQLTYLAFREMLMNDIPPQISRLANLHVLDCSRNCLAEIPTWIKYLTGLTELYLAYNRNVTALPMEIANLKRLKSVDIRQCGFLEFPAALLQLPRLANLNASCNFISQIAPAIVQLPTLRWLDLSSNLLSRDEQAWLLQELSCRSEVLV